MVETTANNPLPSKSAASWFDFPWTPHRQRLVLLIGIGLQMVILVGIMAVPLWTSTTGKVVLLRVVPFDPRDFFRGEYVALNYSFSQFIPADLGDPALELKKGQSVYVNLKPSADGVHWEFAGYATERPSSGVFLHGQLQNYNNIQFGIETFFVEFGQGQEYEKAAREGTLSAEVAIGGSGRGVLRRLVIQPR